MTDIPEAKKIIQYAFKAYQGGYYFSEHDLKELVKLIAELNQVKNSLEKTSKNN